MWSCGVGHTLGISFYGNHLSAGHGNAGGAAGAQLICEKDRKVYQLISAGFLPSADTVTKDGRPAWSFESLASIVGCKDMALAELLMNQGERYRPSTGSRH